MGHFWQYLVNWKKKKKKHWVNGTKGVTCTLQPLKIVKTNSKNINKSLYTRNTNEIANLKMIKLKSQSKSNFKALKNITLFFAWAFS